MKNIELTAPYFYNAQVKNLEDAVYLMQKHQLELNPNKAPDILREPKE